MTICNQNKWLLLVLHTVIKTSDYNHCNQNKRPFVITVNAIRTSICNQGNQTMWLPVINVIRTCEEQCKTLCKWLQCIIAETWTTQMTWVSSSQHWSQKWNSSRKMHWSQKSRPGKINLTYIMNTQRTWWNDSLHKVCRVRTCSEQFTL